jgi:hypothetical protein
LEPWLSLLLEPWLSLNVADGVSDGPVGSERPQAVDMTARVRQATAIQLEQRLDIGNPLEMTVSIRGHRQFEPGEVPV